VHSFLSLQFCDPARRSAAVSFLETAFGVGLASGPLAGGILYESGGFCAPFVACGGALVVVGALAVLFLPAKEGSSPLGANSDVGERREKVGFRRLLRLPTVIYFCFALFVSGVSASWYLPSLQVSHRRTCISALVHMHHSNSWRASTN